MIRLSRSLQPTLTTLKQQKTSPFPCSCVREAGINKVTASSYSHSLHYYSIPTSSSNSRTTNTHSLLNQVSSNHRTCSRKQLLKAAVATPFNCRNLPRSTFCTQKRRKMVSFLIFTKSSIKSLRS